MQARPYKTVVVDATDGVATVTLNRPERRNAIGVQMVNELLYALEDAHEDAAVRSIVLTGAGTTFCAGGDFSQMGAGSGDSELPPKGDYKDLLLALLAVTKPVIARVNGHAMGGGLGLVAASTFAVAAQAAKLGTPEINVGLFPYMITAVLERLMPRRRLVDMFLSGQRLTADEAMAAGLINKAVAAEALDDEVRGYCDMIASKSPVAIAMGLKAMRDTEELGIAEKLPILNQRLFAALGTEDAQEGLRAFLQKREPVWKGR